MHDHAHQHSSIGNKLILSLTLTALVFLAELIGGFWTNSLALLSDAWHVLTDVLALGMTWLAIRQATRPPTGALTFGFHRMEVIAAFVNGLSLLVITAWIFVEAVQRFFAPVEVRSKEMFIIAAVGLIANLLIAVVLNGHAGENLNVKSAFLHVIGDAAASLGVIVAGFLMLRFQWYQADPLISVAISLVIVRGAYRIVRETVHILMEGTPRGLHMEEIVRALERLPGVKSVHDLHAWNISYNIPSVSMHIIVDPGYPDFQEVLDRCNRVLARDFGIFHSTIQLECRCGLEGEVKCSLVAGKKCSRHIHGHNDHHEHHEHA